VLAEEESFTILARINHGLIGRMEIAGWHQRVELDMVSAESRPTAA